MSDASTDPVVFAAEVLGLDVQEHQAEALRCGKRVTVIAGGRRSAKSWSAQVKANHVCWTQRNVQVLVMHTDRDKGREWLRECADLMQRSRLGRAVELDEQAQVLRFPGSGSEIVVLASTNRSPRGFGRRVVLVIVEEASYQANVVWSGLRYTLLDNNAEAWLVGTPDCAYEHFFRQSYELGQGGDPDYAAFSWRTAQNRRISQGDIEREAERLPEGERLRQLEGVWTDAAGSLFSRELLERQTADLVIPTIGQVRGPARPAVGFDHGVSYDRSALVLVYRLPVGALNGDSGRSGFAGIPDEVMPRFVALPHVWPAKTPMSDTVRDVVAINTVPQVVSTETSGVGAMPSQELQRLMAERWPGRGPVWNMVATTNAKKTAGYGALLALLERGQLVLPRDPDLLRQLAGLRFERGDRGFTTIEAESAATHDDVADAAMLAMGPFGRRNGRGQILTAMLKYGSPNAAPPDFVRDEWGRDAAVVETGGGLRVWQVPPLQSVFGREVTYPSQTPAPAEQADPEPLAPSREKSFAGLSRATWAP